MSQVKSRIPTNIITGFLGVGKTTTIKQLLKYKPENEVWAVLVNEFGQVGIDGALLSASQSGDSEGNKKVVVKEVPGGCLCCVAGLPMKMGLNMLISQFNPDRIFIEPTGLGHLKQVIADLTGEFYIDVLDLRATICLLNPRHLSDTKYRENNHFQDQIGIADILVANKTEELSADIKQSFYDFSNQLQPKKAALSWTERGDISFDLLALPLDQERKTAHLDNHLAHHHHHHDSEEVQPMSDDARFIRKFGQGQGLYTYGWIFNGEQCFDLMKLATLLENLNLVRLKSVLITDEGCFAINSVDNDCEFNPVANLTESKIEIISADELIWQQLEESFCDCLIS